MRLLRCVALLVATLQTSIALRLSNEGSNRATIVLEKDLAESNDEVTYAANMTYVDDVDSLLTKEEDDKCAEPAYMAAHGFSRVCCNFYVQCFNKVHWKKFNGLSSAKSAGYRADLALHVQQPSADTSGAPQNPQLPPARRPEVLPDYMAMLPKLSEPGVTIYVPSINMLDFLDAFVLLPNHARVTLVTGNEDVGMPRELWGEGRPEQSRRAPTAMGYRDFIADPRLTHWFVQNYDLTGCGNQYGCSPIKEDDPLALKVTPIPIGLEFYVRSEEKPVREHGYKRESVAEQHAFLEKMRGRGVPFEEKVDNILFMPFQPFSRDGVDKHRLSRKSWKHLKSRRNVMWWYLTTKYLFVAAPFGHGMDTYRLWETLALGSIPVVRTSSLDRLYRQFPIIIVQDWDEVDDNSFAKWKAEITDRFGPDPFLSVQQKLHMKYWLDLVKEVAAPGSAKSSKKSCVPSSAGDIDLDWHCPQWYSTTMNNETFSDEPDDGGDPDETQ